MKLSVNTNRIKHVLANVVIADPARCVFVKLTFLRTDSECPDRLNCIEECTMAGPSSNVRLSSIDLR